MTLIEQLKADQLEARKARDQAKASLLTSLYSEASMPGLNDGHRLSTDSEVVKVIKRFHTNVSDNIKLMKDSGLDETRIADLEKELAILNQYIPSNMTDDELKEAIRVYIKEAREYGLTPVLGQVMTHLRTNHGGKYDGATAKNIAVSLL